VLLNNQNLVKSNLSKGTLFFEETSGLGSIFIGIGSQRRFQRERLSFGRSFLEFPFRFFFWGGGYLYQKIHGVSCSGAVTVFISSLVKMDRRFPCSCTSNFCTNRAKLAVKTIQKLRNLVYYKLHQKVSPENRWHGHDVFYVDGTIISLDDTPANQDQFPQSSSQKDSLGFPLIRAVFVFSMLTAMNWIALSDGELNGSTMETFLGAISQLIVPKQERPPEPRVVKKRKYLKFLTRKVKK
jgi:hypothetical protein